VNALSGVVSPTAFGVLASPVATPRTTPRNTPRSTPIPRWCTPFVGLDENMDYALMINLPGCSMDDMLHDSTLLGMFLLLLLLLIIIFDPGTQFPGNEKITLCNTEKYKNQAGMNLTPPPPSQNTHAVRWHCTSDESNRI